MNQTNNKTNHSENLRITIDKRAISFQIGSILLLKFRETDWLAVLANLSIQCTHDASQLSIVFINKIQFARTL